VIDVLEGSVKVSDFDSLCPITVQGGDHAVINPGKFPCRIRDIRLQELKELVAWVGKALMKLRKLDELGSNLILLPKLKDCDILPAQLAVSAESLKPPPLKPLQRKMAKPEPEFEEIQKAKLKELEYKKIHEDTFRSPADIANVIASNHVSMRRLYNQFLKEKSFSGRVLIRFAINPDGSVADPSIANSSTDMPEFDGELVKTLLTVKFKPVKGSTEQVKVVYPFDFKM
jgi:TonB family protein